MQRNALPLIFARVDVGNFVIHTICPISPPPYV
jgi:hypothetical protein